MPSSAINSVPAVGARRRDRIVDRVDRWHAPGILFLGDAAHTMSPVGAPTTLPWGIVFPYAGDVARTVADERHRPLRQGRVDNLAVPVGVDVDQSFLGPHILTSAVKRVDQGIFLAVKGAKSGKGYKGGGNLVFNLKNGGMSVGKINPTVPKAYIKLMNTYKTNIIKKKLKVPAKL